MVFSKNIARASCADILHPWTQNCSLAHRTMMRTSLLGSSKLLVPLILVSLFAVKKYTTLSLLFSYDQVLG
jgi:hypothetical protein